MKNMQKVIIILGAILFLISCESTATAKTKNQSKETSIESTVTTPSETSIPSFDTETTPTTTTTPNENITNESTINESTTNENTINETTNKPSNTIEQPVTTPNSNTIDIKENTKKTK